MSFYFRVSAQIGGGQQIFIHEIPLLTRPDVNVFIYTWKSSLLRRLTISLILILKDTTGFSFSLSLKM